MNQEERISHKDRSHHSVGRMTRINQTALLQRRARKQALRFETDAQDLSSAKSLGSLRRKLRR